MLSALITHIQIVLGRRRRRGRGEEKHKLWEAMAVFTHRWR